MPSRNIPQAVRNRLWAVALNNCAQPDCDELLTVQSEGAIVTLGKIAHISSHSPGGPRYDVDLTDDDRTAYENLLLLCGKHHDIVDRDEGSFTTDELRSWKLAQEERYHAAVGKEIPLTPRLPPLAHPFIARAETQALRATLHSHRLAVLEGFPGAGKTQIALEYCLQAADVHALIWWASAATPAELLRDLGPLASHYGWQANVDGNIPDQLTSALPALGRAQGLLLVLDGALGDHWIDFALSCVRTGHVIVTTTEPRPISETSVIRLGRVDAEFAAALFGQLGFDVETNDSREAIDLCEGLPLLLSQLASYGHTAGLSAQEAISLFSSRRNDLICRGSAGSHPGLQSSMSILTSSLGHHSLLLLNALAVLAPQPVPLKKMHSGMPPPFNDPIVVEDTLAELRSRSLIERDRSGVNLHGAVQDLIQNRLGASDLEKAKAIAHLIIGTQVPTYMEPRDLEFMFLLAPHIEVILTWLDFHGHPLEASMHLGNRLGVFYTAIGSYESARKHFSDALRLNGNAQHAEAPAVKARASILHNWSQLEAELGDLDTATSLLEESLNLKLKFVGEGDLLTGISWSALGTQKARKGDIQGALVDTKRALAIFEGLGDERWTAECLYDLASFYWEEGEDGKAHAALALCLEQVKGSDLTEHEIRARLLWAAICLLDDPVVSARQAGAARKLAANHNDPYLFASALFAQARSLSVLNPQASLTLLRKARNLAMESTTERVRFAKLLQNVGRLFMALNEPGEGLVCIERGHDNIAKTTVECSDDYAKSCNYVALAIAVLRSRKAAREFLSAEVERCAGTPSAQILMDTLGMIENSPGPIFMQGDPWIFGMAQ